MGSPLGTQGELNGDANNLKTNGCWACESLALNVPSNTGCIINLLTGRYNPQYVQFFIDFSNTSMFTRTCNYNTGWTTWRTI